MDGQTHHDSIYRATIARAVKTGALNSNMTSDYKLEVVIWSKLRMRSDKIAKISEKQRRMAIILT